MSIEASLPADPARESCRWTKGPKNIQVWEYKLLTKVLQHAGTVVLVAKGNR
jgi:hypothetical protein